MATLLREPGLSLDDVLLVPQYSNIESRFSGEIDTMSEIVPGVKIKYPLISSNMDTCTEANMAVAMSNLGCAGIIHRFMDKDAYANQLTAPGINPVIVCIGAKRDSLYRLAAVLERGIRPDAVNIDVAHGDSKHVIAQIHEIKMRWPYPVIAGNVCTFDATLRLAAAGADCIRVGVGNGSICSTRVNTGCGFPQFTALIQAARVKKYHPNVKIISDGGCQEPGDIVKCLAAGADAVMSGRFFSGTKESPGDVIEREGCKYKTYRGMSSIDVQAGWKGSSAPISVEGVSSEVLYKGSVEKVVNNLIYNILSGFSYCGSRTLEELHEKAVFVRQTSAGFRESSTHIFEK